MKQTIVLILILSLLVSVSATGDILLGVQYAGGREIMRTDKDNDTVWVEQSMVHTLIPSEPAGDPVVMVPGMGLGSYIFLSTPDGRKGWAQQFAENGHPVYVYDIPEYSTSGGFDVNKLNDLVSAIEVNIDDPNNPVALLDYPLSNYFSSGGKRPVISSTDLPPTYSYYSTNSQNRNIWSTWGFGSDTDMPYPDVRFPVGYMDQFEKHFPLRYKDDTELEDVAPLTSDLEAEVLIPLCESIGQPVILMLHSAVDFNNNGCVDMDDLGMFSTKWHTIAGESTWDPAYDVKPDNKVDIQGLSLFGTVWIQCD